MDTSWPQYTTSVDTRGGVTDRTSVWTSSIHNIPREDGSAEDRESCEELFWIRSSSRRSRARAMGPDIPEPIPLSFNSNFLQPW